MARAGDEPRSGAQTVERAMSLLRCFEHGPTEIRLSELAQRTGLTVSTTHRLARALCAGGLLMQNPANERYCLGPTLVVLGRRAEASLGYDRALPPLRLLAEETGESVNLGIRAGADVLVVLDVPSSSPLRFSQEAGSRVPIHTSAMGKCLLAFSPHPAQEVAALGELPRVTERTITERARLAEQLALVRDRGWGLNDEERNPGVRAMAVPVLRPDGTAAGAIAVQGPAIRIDDARLQLLLGPLQRTAASLAPILVASD